MTLKRFLLLWVMTVTPSSLFSNTLYFPQVAVGGGYSTTFVIVNTGTTPVSSHVDFYKQGDTALEIWEAAREVSSFLSSVSARIQASANLSAAQQRSLTAQVQAIQSEVSAAVEAAASLQAQISALEAQIAPLGQATDTQQQQLATLRLELVSVWSQIYSAISMLAIVCGAAPPDVCSFSLIVQPIIPRPLFRLVDSRAINVPVGGSTRFTLPNVGPLRVVWGELAAGSGTVQGVATLDLRADNGALITTASVLGIEAGNRFLLPVDVTSTASTGVAIANVIHDLRVKLNVGLRLLREDGSPMASANDVRLSPLGSERQISEFVTSLFPQLIGTTFKGTLVVENAPGAPANSLAVAALTVKEGALSPLPVVPGAGSGGSTGGNTLYFPQVAFGGGYSTSFVIMNTGATNVSSRLNFYDQSGGSRVAYSAAINVPAGGSSRLTLPNTGPLTVVWGELPASPGTVQGMAAFDLRADNSALIATAGVPGVEAGNRFLFPVDVTPTASTGIAIANVKDVPVNVGLRLLKEDGSPMASANDVRLTPLGSRRQIANFVTSLFPQLIGTTFKGTLVVEAATGAPANSLAATSLTVKERGSPSEFAPSALTALPRDLTPATWQSLTDGLRTEEVDLSLPKLKLSYERKLNGDLQALGMISAFVPFGADFTRMSHQGRDLYIGFVKQKTFVDINEEGTEAAAVTVTAPKVACLWGPRSCALIGPTSSRSANASPARSCSWERSSGCRIDLRGGVVAGIKDLKSRIRKIASSPESVGDGCHK